MGEGGLTAAKRVLLRPDDMDAIMLAAPLAIPVRMSRISFLVFNAGEAWVRKEEGNSRSAEHLGIRDAGVVTGIVRQHAPRVARLPRVAEREARDPVLGHHTQRGRLGLRRGTGESLDRHGPVLRRPVTQREDDRVRDEGAQEDGLGEPEELLIGVPDGGLERLAREVRGGAQVGGHAGGEGDGAGEALVEHLRDGEGDLVY